MLRRAIDTDGLFHACRGDLLSALLQLDKEDDVNKVLRYFSYEHFYVIYCKVQNAALRSEHLAACIYIMVESVLSSCWHAATTTSQAICAP
jgi:hypothetical protein